MERSRDGGRLAAYAGLTLADRQSGTLIKGAFKNQPGNHRLKNAMFIAAFVAHGTLSPVAGHHPGFPTTGREGSTSESAPASAARRAN